MKIGILGAGLVGGSLALGWTKAGHDVVIGVRDPNSEKTRKALAETGGQTRAVSQQEAAAFGDVVVVAVPGAIIRSLIPTLGDLSGKVIIDAANRFQPGPDDGPSVAHDIAALAPGAKVVKAFNTMSYLTMRQPVTDGVAATLIIAGDDEGAKATVTRLAEDLGLDVADAGSLDNAPLLEGILPLYIALSQKYGRGVAFKILKP